MHVLSTKIIANFRNGSRLRREKDRPQEMKKLQEQYGDNGMSTAAMDGIEARAIVYYVAGPGLEASLLILRGVVDHTNTLVVRLFSFPFRYLFAAFVVISSSLLYGLFPLVLSFACCMAYFLLSCLLLVVWLISSCLVFCLCPVLFSAIFRGLANEVVSAIYGWDQVTLCLFPP